MLEALNWVGFISFLSLLRYMMCIRVFALWTLIFQFVRKKQASDHKFSGLFCDPLRCQVPTEVPSNTSMVSGDMIAIRNSYTIYSSWFRPPGFSVI